MRMNRLWHAWFLLIPACWLFACSGGSNGDEDGNDTRDVDDQTLTEDYLPASGEISGWEEDTTKGEPGVEAAYTKNDGEGLIDGALDTFYETGKWVGLAIEYYVNGDMSVELRLFEMEDAAACQQVYEYLETYPPGTPWEAVGPGLGDASRWADQGPYWLIHVRQGAFLVQATFRPGDETGQDPAKAFLGAFLDKIP